MEKEHIPDLYSLRKAITHKNQNYWMERLVNELHLFIAKTSTSVFPRKHHFNLNRSCFPTSFRSQKPSETQWENWCLDRWSIKRETKNVMPVANAWLRLIARQIPLEPPIFQRQLITADLIGISEDNLPVIVELKGHAKQAVTLGLILQALDYAIRLRESWIYFFEELQDFLKKCNWPMIQNNPDRIYMVCAAPSDVWTHEQQPRFAPNYPLYIELKQALNSCGFPVSLVSLRTDAVNTNRFQAIAEPFDFINPS
jgi:hypothetical protein